jgi:hypothetical protein
MLRDLSIERHIIPWSEIKFICIILSYVSKIRARTGIIYIYIYE